MELSVAVFFLEDENPDTNNAKLSRRQLRDKYNVMEQPTNVVSKEIFWMLLEKMMKHSPPAYRTTHLREDIKLATFLRFLATGSYQQTVGNEVHSSTGKSTVCRVISECLKFFQDHICDNWIEMPDPGEENAIIKAFFDSTGFPGIIGCVDGTHIRITKRNENYCPEPEIVISAEINEEEDGLESEELKAISIRRNIAINL
ncbi:uncharacterized protein LOC142235281 [Haematobia irritans]|uniref:uncharacterized protein LOC142235281 n=1 Tax=Haematobia irritans TaxID=7368 RepID=UPI003F50C741